MDCACAEIATFFLAHAQLPHLDMLYAIQCFIASYVPKQLKGIPSPRFYSGDYPTVKEWTQLVEPYMSDDERLAFARACRRVKDGGANTLEMISILACKSPAELQKQMHPWYSQNKGGMPDRHGVGAAGRCVCVCARVCVCVCVCVHAC